MNSQHLDVLKWMALFAVYDYDAGMFLADGGLDPVHWEQAVRDLEIAAMAIQPELATQMGLTAVAHRTVWTLMQGTIAVTRKTAKAYRGADSRHGLDIVCGLSQWISVPPAVLAAAHHWQLVVVDVDRSRVHVYVEAVSRRPLKELACALGLKIKKKG